MLRLSMKETYITIVPIPGHSQHEFISMKNAIPMCMLKFLCNFLDYIIGPVK